MYPQRELKRLATHKVWLRRRIVEHRFACVAAASHVARPFALLDRVMGFWRRLSPLARLAALPLGVLVTRKFFPRWKTLGAVLRWAPLVGSVMSGLSAAVRSRAGSAPPNHGQQ